MSKARRSLTDLAKTHELKSVVLKSQVNKESIPTALPDFEEQDGSIADPEVDPGIAPVVRLLRQNGVETCQSCQGGPGHSSREPYVEFLGGAGAGPLAVGVALTYGIPVSELQKSWYVFEHILDGPIWRLTLTRRGLADFLKTL